MGGLTEISEVRVLARTIMCETMSWQSDLTLFIFYHSNRRTLKRGEWKMEKQQKGFINTYMVGEVIVSLMKGFEFLRS